MFTSPIFSSGIETGDIGHSLRFRGAESLTRTPASTTDRKTWSLSLWAKRSTIGAAHCFFSANGGTTATRLHCSFGSSADTIVITDDTTNYFASSEAFRDTTGWYHILIVCDTTQATAANRLKVFVNSKQLTNTSGTLLALNQNLGPNTTAVVHSIGNRGWASDFYYSGQLARVCFLDGQARVASDFVYLNPLINEYISQEREALKLLVDAAGVNSFMLDFNLGSSLLLLGTDYSNKGNTWTLSGHSITPGADYDWLSDVPGNSYATLNSLYEGKSTLTKANLTASGTTDLPTLTPVSGSWYFEIDEVAKSWTPPAAFPGAAGNYNFGQRPFSNIPTVGHLLLCQSSIDTPAINNPTDAFQTVLSTGAGIKAAAEATFTGDIIEWIKNRSAVNNHQVLDSVRGLTAIVQPNTTAIETVYSAPANNSVAWVWKAGTASAINNAGTLQSQVSANVAAGISVVTYTANGLAGDTVGHGLGAAPKMVIAKNRVQAANWPVYHQQMTGIRYKKLNLTDAYTPSTVWNSAPTTATVFEIGSGTESGQSGNDYLALCFAEIAGFSKIYAILMNGVADGAYVDCGFKPAFVLMAKFDFASAWTIHDSKRSPSNPVNEFLVPNTTAVEATTGLILDFTSQGFKIRTALTDAYIFLAFAEVAGKYSLAR